jgi:hypothetical protein
MTILNAGEKTILTTQESQALNIIGAAGAQGVVYRLNDVLGGGNSLQSWIIGTGALPVIGPFPGINRFLITCSVGSITAAVNAAVLSLSSAGAVATITGNYVVGQALKATLPTGVIGTLQFTRTLVASPFTKTNIAGAVANAVNTLSYTLTPADAAYSVSCDASNQVTPSIGGVVASAPTPTAPTIVSAAAIVGTPTVGVAAVLAGATFSGYPTPTIARVISVGGAVVATGDQTTGYTPVSADIGKTMTFADTATNGIAPNATSTSVASAAITGTTGATGGNFTTQRAANGAAVFA